MSNDLTPEVAWVYELRWEGTNEIYIGSTSQHPENRFKGHKAKPYKCYEHLGIENAKLAWCYPYEPKDNYDRDEEILWKAVSRRHGYIVLDDGDKHNKALRLSEDDKRKLSEAGKIAMNRPEVKRKLIEAHKRPETILKRRQAQGKPFTVTWPNGLVKNYLSSYEAAADLGVTHKTIQGYLKGEYTPGGSKKTARLRGCVFEYI
jgi:hypothetical protein